MVGYLLSSSGEYENYRVKGETMPLTLFFFLHRKWLK